MRVFPMRLTSPGRATNQRRADRVRNNSSTTVNNLGLFFACVRLEAATDQPELP